MKLVANALLSESNMGPGSAQYIGTGQHERKCWCMMAELECLYTNRGVDSGPTLF